MCVRACVCLSVCVDMRACVHKCVSAVCLCACFTCVSVCQSVSVCVSVCQCYWVMLAARVFLPRPADTLSSCRATYERWHQAIVTGAICLVFSSKQTILLRTITDILLPNLPLYSNWSCLLTSTSVFWEQRHNRSLSNRQNARPYPITDAHTQTRTHRDMRRADHASYCKILVQYVPIRKATDRP